MDIFYNYTSEKFSYTWGGVSYSFAPGSVSSGVVVADDGQHSLTLNDVLCRFFAKHLAEHVLNSNISVGKDAMKYNYTNMEMLTERGLNPPERDLQMPSFSNEIDLLKDAGVENGAGSSVLVDVEDKQEDAPKRKPGRPAKKVAEEATPSAGVEFNM